MLRVTVPCLAIVGVCLSAVTVARADMISLSSATGFTITWDGNEGDNFGASAPANLATSGTAFGSSEFDVGVHFIANINDGLYGNAQSWLAAAPDTAPYIGVALASSTELASVAFGRDNGGEATQFSDRFAGIYKLQFTQVASPGIGTTDTGDETTGWNTIGTVTIADTASANLGYLRHEFEIGLSSGGGITATGFRITVPNVGIAIDELELTAIPEPGTLVLGLIGVLGLMPVARQRFRRR